MHPVTGRSGAVAAARVSKVGAGEGERRSRSPTTPATRAGSPSSDVDEFLFSPQGRTAAGGAGSATSAGPASASTASRSGRRATSPAAGPGARELHAAAGRARPGRLGEELVDPTRAIRPLNPHVFALHGGAQAVGRGTSNRWTAPSRVALLVPSAGEPLLHAKSERGAEAEVQSPPRGRAGCDDGPQLQSRQGHPRRPALRGADDDDDPALSAGRCEPNWSAWRPSSAHSSGPPARPPSRRRTGSGRSCRAHVAQPGGRSSRARPRWSGRGGASWPAPAGGRVAARAPRQRELNSVQSSAMSSIHRRSPS